MSDVSDLLSQHGEYTSLLCFYILVVDWCLTFLGFLAFRLDSYNYTTLQTLKDRLWLFVAIYFNLLQYKKNLLPEIYVSKIIIMMHNKICPTTPPLSVLKVGSCMLHPACVYARIFVAWCMASCTCAMLTSMAKSLSRACIFMFSSDSKSQPFTLIPAIMLLCWMYCTGCTGVGIVWSCQLQVRC